MKPILVLTIREHGMEDDIYVFANRNVNILPTIKEWLVENDVKLDIPNHVTDSESFFEWYFKENIDRIIVYTSHKQLLEE